MRPDLKKLSRRSFLEESMLAAVAASAAGSLAGQVLAEDAPASNSPSEKLSVAVIGVNGRGQTHIDAFINAKNGTEITYICDADKAVGEKRCQAIAEKTGKKPKFAQDMREVFDDESVDIVSTATPNHWHALTAIWAMQAGKDVYVEKPVSHNVSEGRRMVEAARKYNKICQTGTQCRSTKANHEALKYIRDGKIGEVKLARALCYKGRGPIGKRGEYQPPAEVDYNLWTGPAPMVVLTRPKLHYDWHWVWPTGNGDLGNQGIHQMDVARWMLGVDDLGKSVYSFGGRVGYTDAGDTANTQVCVHEFDGDKAIIFEVRGLKTQPLLGANVGNIFYGTDGYVVMDGYSSGAAFDKDGKKIVEFKGGDDHFGNFLKAVRSRKYTDLNADILEGHLSSALCHLGNISLRLGAPKKASELHGLLETSQASAAVLETADRLGTHLADNKLKPEETQMFFGPKLTLEGETFTGEGSDKANPMLTREYRAPFVVPATV